MRYYNLIISDPKSGAVWKPTATGNGFKKDSKGGSTFTSHDGNTPIAGALNIEFDVPTVPFNTPQGATAIRVWGIGLGMISQASDLNGAEISLSAGMKKGLPLVNPKQAGLILQGSIFQSYGNWQGTNQSLDFICNPSAAAYGQDIAFYWPAGMSLATALVTAFAQAFPKLTPKVTIAPIQSAADGSGRYTSLSQLAEYVTARSIKLGPQGVNYSGVQITVIGNTIFAFDSQNPLGDTELVFRDLIGQPTWIGPNTVNFKTVLRSDIAVGSKIKFPSRGILTPYVLTSASAAVPGAPAASKTAFQGEFLVTEVHHFANFRQPDADSWTTTFNAASIS